MADVINRKTKEYLKSVNTPDFSEKDWIINPVMPKCDEKEWVIEGNVVRETTREEKDIKIAAIEAKAALIVEQEATAKEETAAQVIINKENFMKLTVEEKMEYLYDMRL